MENVPESYWQERMAISPSYIGIWCHYQEIQDSRIVLEGLRWIVVQNGVLFWYTDDIMSDSEGFFTLSSTEILTSDEFDKFRLTMSSKNHTNTIVLTFKKSQELFIREVIQINSQITHPTLTTPPSPSFNETTSHQSLDEPQLGTMQINIKDIRHVIEIYTTDDAYQVANEFINEHKLKSSSLTRIELELLRTQLDTCHVYQAKLRQYISYLRRSLICSSDLEGRVLSLEYHLQDLLLTTLHFKYTIFQNFKQILIKKTNKIKKLQKKNENLQEIIQKIFEKLKEKQQTEKMLTFHCYEIEEKLRRAIEVISNSSNLNLFIEREEQETRENSSLIRNLNFEFKSDQQANEVYGDGDGDGSEEEDQSEGQGQNQGQGEEKRGNNGNTKPTQVIPSSSVGTMTEQSQVSPPSLSPSLSPSNSRHGHQNSLLDSHSTAVARLATETSGIFTMTMDTLKAEYERKLQEYEKQQIADQKTIQILQNENEIMKLQLQDSYSHSQPSLPPPSPSSLLTKKCQEEKTEEINQLLEQIKHLKEQQKSLTTTASTLRVSLQQSQSKNELLSLQTQNISKRSQEQEEENKEIRRQLTDLAKSIQVNNVHKLEEENRSLNEQVVTLRGEVLRLQAEIQEIQERAIQAVHVVQLLDKETPSPMLSKNSSTKSLTISRSQSRSLNEPSLSYTPTHDIGDGQVTVELSLEPDDDEDDEEEEEHERDHEGEEDNQTKETEEKSKEVYTEAEVDLMLQQSIVNLKLEEKSFAALSPVVEDRLLRNIYHKYALETTGYLTLSRFGRFTKEFKIAGSTTNEHNNHTSQPMLVYGDIDVVFVTTLARIPPEDPSDLATPQKDETLKRTPPPSHAFIPPGKVTSSDTPSRIKSTNSHMAVNQFLVAIQELAVRLYSKVIEMKTGTVLECLPTQQKDRAIRAALDVFILKKIVPTANQLGLIPWELMVLDQCLTTIHSSEVVRTSLVNHIHIFLSWFNHYSRIIQINLSNTNNSAGMGEEKGWNTKSRDLRSPVANHSPIQGFNSSQHSSYSPSPNHLKSTGGGVGGGVGGGAYGAYTPSPRRALSHSQSVVTHNFRGITYKEISKFYHDYGIVPYLLKEPQLYNLFKEVFLWARSNIELLLIALPEQICSLPAVQQELQLTSIVKQKYSKKQIIGLGSFFVLFCTIGTQAFKELPPEKRVSRLFQWTAQSGGSYLMQQKFSF